MKTKFILTGLLFTTLSFVGCEKKEIKPNTVQPVEKHQIIQRYIYKDQTYQIELTYDKDYSIIDVKGDVNAYVALLQKQTVSPEAFLVEQPNIKENIFNIRVFDDVLKMNSYQHKEGISIEATEKGCTNWTSTNGTASYRFYEHINHGGEFTALKLDNQSYFQREYFSWENDKISSLKLWGTTTGASVDLFEHSCFSGKTIRFSNSTPGLVQTIPDLRMFPFDWCTDVIRDVYGNVVQINTYPCGNWNDKVSSIKGWSI